MPDKSCAQGAILIQGISKRFEGFSLQDVSMSIPRGRIVGLIGRNGAGKSTCLKCILGLVQWDSGAVIIPSLGPLPADAIERRKRIGYIAEHPTFYEWMTVERLIRFVASFYPSWDMQYSADLLDRYELEPRKRIRHLSKGMRAKLALLLALAHRPRIMLLDEPTSGLDPLMKDQFLQEVRGMVEDGRVEGVVISSHILGEIEQYSDNIAILRDGKLSLCSEKRALVRDWIRFTFTLPDDVPAPKPIARWSRRTGDGLREILARRGNDEIISVLRECGARDITASEPDLRDVLIQEV